MIKTVYDDPYLRAELEPRDLVLRVARTAKPFENLALAETSHRSLAEASSALPKGVRMLLDLRDAPSRNDPEFEAVIARHRRPIFEGCRKVAVLVKTAVGKLHVTRMHHDEREPARVQVFDDEDRAFEWLLA